MEKGRPATRRTGHHPTCGMGPIFLCAYACLLLARLNASSGRRLFPPDWGLSWPVSSRRMTAWTVASGFG